jgi:hypothetical protein
MNACRPSAALVLSRVLSLVLSLVLLPLAGTALATPTPAPASQCRAALRPLLLAHEPAPDTIESVRAQCRREADTGSADAAYQLGTMDLGLGGHFDQAEATSLIQDAAGRNVPEAQYWVAWQHEAGPYLAHDAALARDWYLKAAALNHKLAIARLADAYEKGELGLPVDAKEAAKYRALQARCARKEAEDAAAAATAKKAAVAHR